MWELDSAAPPADPEARQIQITLAQPRPRYVSPDLEFAVWTATIGESREGEASRSGLSLEAAQHEAGVVPAEAERVRDGDPDVGLARLVRNVVEVAFGIGCVVVDRRR
jgi:hypothetical protein